MATTRPITSGWSGILTYRPPADPRYWVLQRREVRESIHEGTRFAVAAVVAVMLLVGPADLLLDAAALLALSICAVVTLRGSLVRRHSYASCVAIDYGLVVMNAVAVVELPDRAALTLGLYCCLIVGAGGFNGFDQRLHVAWLAGTLAIFTIAIFLAPIGLMPRAEGTFMAVTAVVVSAGSHWVTQHRRDRAYIGEAMLRQQRQELRSVIAHLEDARTTIATLEGVLPICAHCKRIRDVENEWVRVEEYVEQRSTAQFSHGVCPDCLDQLYPGLLDEREMGHAAS